MSTTSEAPIHERQTEGGANRPDPAEVRVVQDIVSEVVKALKARRLYEPGNRMVETRFERLRSLVQPRLAAGDLQFEIVRSELRWQGETVYRDETRDSSLALRLYAEGLRRLTLSKELGDADLRRLLDVLGTDPRDDHGAEDDVVTLLWERDIHGVDYEVAEAMVHDAGEGGGIAEFLDTEDPSAWDNGEPPAAAEAVATSDLDDLQRPESLPTERVRLSPAEEGVLRNELAREAERDLLRDIVDLLFETIELTDDDAERERLREVGGQVLRSILQEDEPQRLLAVLMRVLLLKEYYFADSERVRPLLEDLLALVGSDAGLDCLCRVGGALTGDETEGLGGLLRALPDEATARLVRAVGSASSPALRGLFARVAVERGVGARAFARALEVASGPGALHLVAVIAGLDGGGPLLLQAMHHADPGVRRAALFGAAKVSPEAVQELLRQHLDDDDPRVRMAALDALRVTADESAAALLAERIEDRSFPDRDPAERRETIATYAALAGAEAYGLLRRLLFRRSLFSRRQRRGDGPIVAEVLARLGDSGAIALLEEGAGGKRGDVRKACRALLLKRWRAEEEAR